MRKLILIALLAASCSSGSPYKEYVVCVNRQCEVYIDVQSLEVCVNTWDDRMYDFTTECFNITDMERR